MEIGWTDVGIGGYILVSCAHSNTSYKLELSEISTWKISCNPFLANWEPDILLSVKIGRHHFGMHCHVSSDVDDVIYPANCIQK
jgi:hypothetical protein